MLKYFTILFIAVQAINTQAAGLNALENFLKSTQSGKAEFSQVVTSPAKTEAKPDAKSEVVEKSVAKVKTSSGTFEFSRPNKFKFLYKKPFEQTIVADGTTLWLFDVDLNQVTARKQSQALGSTPAALIATAAGLIVAVPSVVFYNYYMKRIKHNIPAMEKEIKELVYMLKKGE